MSPASRSRSSSNDYHHSYNKQAGRYNGGGRKENGGRYMRSDNQYTQRRPPSPPPMPSMRRNGRGSYGGGGGGGKYDSRSPSPSAYKRTASRRYPSRSRSRSPLGGGMRSSREKPQKGRCIGVFGLSVYTTQHKIREIFSKFGPIRKIQVVVDSQTGRSRGFCFIYYEHVSDASAAKDACSGMEIDERRVRVDYSITQRPHSPTPGVYMGRYGKIDQRERPSRRSPSFERNNYRNNDRRRRVEYSRSRSRSPRRQRY